MEKGRQTGYIHLSPDNLMTHPKNLRRFYPEEQVREMAESIRQAKGVYQALLIVPNGRAEKYFVVDGNIRLAGARALGRECPPLKCEVIDAGKAEQLLAMVVTSQFRYDPDPISEALHYRRLIDEEGYTQMRIAQATGVSSPRIAARLKLLKLDPEIQELVAHGKLPKDERVAEAFLSIGNVKARVKLAQRLGETGASVNAILSSCERLATRLRETGSLDFSGKTPSLALGQQKASGKTMQPETRVKIPAVRKAAKAMCGTCDAKAHSPVSVPEPAWSLVSHSAEETCGHCNLKEIKGCCGECPAVDLIRRLITAVWEPDR